MHLGKDLAMLRFCRQLARCLEMAERRHPIRSRAARPVLEPIEGRVLLNGAVHHPARHPVHFRPAPPVDPLARYSIFQATIDRGPHAGLVLQGPLVLGISGRIQVNGYLFASSGQTIGVVGTVFAGGANLRFVLPGRFGTGALEVAGSGILRQVPNGLPGGMALIGSGNVSGPASNDSGHWVTLLPNVHRAP